MARIALGITLALLIVTCVFVFLTRAKVADLGDKVVNIGMELSSTQQRLAKSAADLKSSQDNLAKETADDEQTKTNLSSVQGSLDAANSQVSDLSAKVKDLTSKLLATGTNINPVQVNPNGPSQADMDKLNGQLKDAQAQVAELTQLKDTLANKTKDAESRADDLQKIVDHYKNSTLRNGLEGEVLAVNPGWNFVVLSIGDHQGAVANAEMILQRGGSQIGKVRITEVEPSTSVADIIPGSLARGVQVQPGDRVIFPGS
jgi:hypothetical protein